MLNVTPSATPLSDQYGAAYQMERSCEDSIDLELIKNPVALVPCGHVHDIRNAILYFGELIAATATMPMETASNPKKNVCSICRSHVITYINVPLVKDLMEQGTKLVRQNEALALEVDNHRRQILQAQQQAPRKAQDVGKAPPVVTMHAKPSQPEIIDTLYAVEYPGIGGKFSCNRQWTPMSTLEMKKYGDKRWISFKNDGRDAFIFYIRGTGDEGGRFKIRIHSAHKEKFGNYLDIFGYKLDDSLDSRQRKTTIIKNGAEVEVDVGVFIADTPEKLTWVLHFLAHGTNALPEEEERLLKELIESPLDWRAVEERNMRSIEARKLLYNEAEKAKIKLEEESRKAAAKGKVLAKPDEKEGKHAADERFERGRIAAPKTAKPAHSKSAAARSKPAGERFGLLNRGNMYVGRNKIESESESDSEHT
jgi:hypothetical protein